MENNFIKTTWYMVHVLQTSFGWVWRNERVLGDSSLSDTPLLFIILSVRHEDSMYSSGNAVRQLVAICLVISMTYNAL